jgi:hypothetical protein
LIDILKQYGTPESDIKKFEKQLKTVKWGILKWQSPKEIWV